jgi:hypothetical protein
MSNLRVSHPSLPGTEDRITVPGRGPGAMPPVVTEALGPARPGVGFAIGLVMGRARILRRPTLLSALLGAALVVVAALIERREGTAGAVDRTLGAAFALVIPLVSFGVAAEATGRGNLRDAVWPAARYGAARREVALGTIVAAAAASAVLGALFAVLAVAAAHGGGNPPLAGDAFMSAWIGALTAAAYTAWFAFGATFGRRGGGRWVPLVLDFALGGSTGVLAAALPREHAVNLLGIVPMGMAQGESSLVLLGSAVVLMGLAALRCRE